MPFDSLLRDIPREPTNAVWPPRVTLQRNYSLLSRPPSLSGLFFPLELIRVFPFLSSTPPQSLLSVTFDSSPSTSYSDYIVYFNHRQDADEMDS